MTQLLDFRPAAFGQSMERRTEHHPHRDAPTSHTAPEPKHLVLYGDFNCPWSYLASRRAALLATDGVTVDWRAVEHDLRRPSRLSDGTVRLNCLREEMERVLAVLLPGEELPHALTASCPTPRQPSPGTPRRTRRAWDHVCNTCCSRPSG